MEVVAENYHNIWAKKKKSDLGSRGDLSDEVNHSQRVLQRDTCKRERMDNMRCGRMWKCLSVVAVFMCACEHMHVSASPVLTEEVQLSGTSNSCHHLPSHRPGQVPRLMNLT